MPPSAPARGGSSGCRPSGYSQALPASIRYQTSEPPRRSANRIHEKGPPRLGRRAVRGGRVREEGVGPSLLLARPLAAQIEVARQAHHVHWLLALQLQLLAVQFVLDLQLGRRARPDDVALLPVPLEVEGAGEGDGRERLAADLVSGHGQESAEQLVFEADLQ